MALYYPLFLNIQGRTAVVVGGGRVAARKIAGLLEAGARVRVVAPEISRQVAAHEIERRPYRTGDLKGAVLAFAATDSRDVNHAVAVEAARRRIPVNVADSAAESTFIVPARITRGEMQIAISTGGRNPRLAGQMRRRLEAELRWAAK
ncbi:MAG TPA: bifunctional precorrin-2 dehydrogenase/sirohydrochlorin ferrochelatase [Bryobacterales bacterium]|jgi:precorrin-2 dehydrogenase/sirohydrochlorin ferrochelatase|nr:bifunctional precorrin-2 dehydrogenase/sirohydrochlorin ferrochelatase [Bryobacterales bacterium]